MKDYELKNVWNADDTGHVRRALSAKSLSVSKGRCNGGKYAKQRIMVLLVVNTLGEKEPPVITGSSAKPRCFKKIQDEIQSCGLYYYANKKHGWIQSISKTF